MEELKINIDDVARIIAEAKRNKGQLSSADDIYEEADAYFKYYNAVKEQGNETNAMVLTSIIDCLRVFSVYLRRNDMWDDFIEKNEKLFPLLMQIQQFDDSIKEIASKGNIE